MTATATALRKQVKAVKRLQAEKALEVDFQVPCKNRGSTPERKEHIEAIRYWNKNPRAATNMSNNDSRPIFCMALGRNKKPGSDSI